MRDVTQPEIRHQRNRAGRLVIYTASWPSGVYVDWNRQIYPPAILDERAGRKMDASVAGARALANHLTEVASDLRAAMNWLLTHEEALNGYDGLVES